METIVTNMWNWDSENKRMVYREIKYVPGFLKIIDEILVNAADNKASISFLLLDTGGGIVLPGTYSILRNCTSCQSAIGLGAN